MSILEANLNLIATIPEEHQEEIRKFLLMNFCEDNPYRPLSINEIDEELTESRACYLCGEGKDFDEAIDEIALKYGL